MLKKEIARLNRKTRIRKTVVGTVERPRLSVFRSLNHFYAQLVLDRGDQGAKTLLGLSTRSKDFLSAKSASKDAGNVKGARELGKLLAQKALLQKISSVVFDRGGFLYHGRIKAFAEGAREGGLKF